MRRLLILCLMLWVVHSQVKKASVPITAISMNKLNIDPLARKMVEVCQEGLRSRPKRNKYAESLQKVVNFLSSILMKIWGSLKTANVSDVVKSASKGLQKVAKATSKGYSKVAEATSKGYSKVAEATSKGYSKVAKATSKGYSKVKKLTGKAAKAFEGMVDEDSPMQEYVIVRMIEDYENSIDGEAPALKVEEMDEQLLEETEETADEGDQTMYQLLYNRIVKGFYFHERARMAYNLTTDDYYHVKIRECRTEKENEESSYFTVIVEMVMDGAKKLQ